ncbi:DNA topoisomerase [Photobacterium indicum]
MNLKPVQHALANMQPNENFRGMTNSALARSIGDQLFGYNFTRGYTLKGREKGFDGVLNVGRVQSAVLGLINSRTLANLNHEESFYYDIHGCFDFNASKVSAKYQPCDADIIDEKNRIIDENCAKNIVQSCRDQQSTVASISTKPESKAAPLPYNLSTLQQTCAKKYGYSATETLDIMQSLYEAHKLLTYPRADCRYLSDEHYANRDLIMQAIAGTQDAFNDSINNADMALNHKAFDADKITAHHAIIPTEKSGKGITLTAKEHNVYQLVATSFIALFYPESVRNKTRATLTVSANDTTYEYLATQSDIMARGWEVLFSEESTSDKTNEGMDLTQLSKGDALQSREPRIEKKKTKPAKYFVESTLLAAMTRAAKFVEDPELRKALEAKDKDNSAESGSIGTEATRAGILEKIALNTSLVSICDEKGYKEKVWKTTKHGQEFCAILPKEIIAPDTSARWAQQQELIRNGQLTVEQFVDELDHYIDAQINDIQTHGINVTSNMESCPICKDGFLRKRQSEKGHFFSCNRYPDCKTTYPEKDGMPDFTKKPKRPPIVSNHKCPKCEKGLIRRKRTKKFKGKISYFWTCSGYPECETTLFDKAGKPNFASVQ